MFDWIFSRQLNTIQKGITTIMLNLQTVLADLNTFRADMTTTLTRVQADLDKLKTSNLSPADQATLESVDQGIKDMDATLKAFDVPTVPPAQ